MASTIYDTHADQLVVHTCWCGIRHAIPSSLSRQATHNGRAVHCPLGHEWVKKETEAERLKKKLQRERADHDQSWAAWRDEKQSLKNQIRSQKAAKTRIKNRVAAGVCPCCNRTFQNLHRHMQSQHPDFASTDN